MVLEIKDNLYVYSFEIIKDINCEKFFKECLTVFQNFDHCQLRKPEINEQTLLPINSISVLSIYFSTSLTDSQLIQLNLLIDNHSSLVYSFLLSGNSNINELSNINHDRKSLQVKNIYIDGLLKEIKYYKNYDATTGTYNNLVVREVRTFYTNVFTGYTHSRSLNIYYYLDNGQIGYSILNQMKYYINIDEQDKNLRERRTIVLAEAKKWLLESYLIPNYGLIALQYAKDFLSELTQAMEKYINGVHTDLQNAINNTTLSFIIPEVKNQLQLLITYQNLEVV